MMNEKEIWKSIPGYKDYEVSNLGRVRSLKWGRERVLRPGLNKRGYAQVVLNKNGKMKTHRVHQLVAQAFLKHTPDGHKTVVDHIDSDTLNNKLENLRLVTHRENITFGTLKMNKISKYTGVTWHKSSKKWLAQIGINGKQKHLGLFDSEEDAGRAYQEKLNELNGIRDKSN